MKREHLLAVVEKAVGRAMQSLMQAHPEALQCHVAQSLEKRLIGMLGAELLLAMGHQSPAKLRAAGEGYSPSPAVRRMQRLQSAAPTGTALESTATTETPTAPAEPQHPSPDDQHGTADRYGLRNGSPAMLALASQAGRGDL